MTKSFLPTNVNIASFHKIATVAALVFLTACGDASKSGGKAPQSSGGDPPSPTSLNMFVEIMVSGAFEGIETLSKQDQDTFLSKNSKSAMTACVTDKFQNDPNFELDKNGGPSMDQYGGKLTDSNPIFEVIKKYGVKELNQQTKLVYEMWVYKGAEAVMACTVQ